MEKKTFIYGASDDLIEIEGAVSDEIGCFDAGNISFKVSDGTSGKVRYDGDWRFTIETAGSLLSKHIKSVGDDLSHPEPYKQFTSYSDILVFDEGVEWVKIGKQKIKA